MPEEGHRGPIEDGWNCDGKEDFPGDLSHLDCLTYYLSFRRDVRRKLDYNTVFVSSPNMDWCPALQSPDAVVYLRGDGTFGPDDPITWPQLYHMDHPYLACIPISDPDENSLVCIFRRGLRTNQVTVADDWDGNHRVYRLSDDLAHELESRVDSFIKEARGSLSISKRWHLRLRYLLKSLSTALSGILRKKDTLFRLRTTFGLVSRFYFEARGYVDYLIKYRPLFKSKCKKDVNPNLVGVLTDDSSTCKKYYQMGIPVWRIRTQAQAFSGTQKFIKRTEPRLYQSRPLWPLDCFRDDGISREELAVHKGQTDMSNLLKVVDEWLKPKFVDLLDDKSRKRKRVEQEDGEISTNAHIESENVQNYELWVKLEPRATDPWVCAAAKCASIPLDDAQHQPRFVPWVDLIARVASLQEAKELVAVWKLIRHWWLREVFMHRKPPDFATQRAWMSFVISAFSDPAVKLNNERSMARIQFAEFMHIPKVISIARDQFVFSKGDIPGTIDEKVPTEMVRDTVCELADLGFFFDMFEVEYYRTYDPPAEIEERLRPVMFPSSFTYPQCIPRSTLVQRTAWLVKVRDFIAPWQTKKPDGFFAPLSDPSTDREVRRFETAVADVYCLNVTRVLRRRPVLPRYR